MTSTKMALVRDCRMPEKRSGHHLQLALREYSFQLLGSDLSSGPPLRIYPL